ncbi:hypothetical protein LX32DRAFT_711411 [Colletotrichum zoysiae]|uniref:Aflatoxin regulatory protein domain-containing protein n=1 Tax=Colletotrichum zoysiae TaxID=1216348 RepID=A0AAD9LU09_9PEZI|nr:hypothetical protein LX32DRAFT_711411 [Colletotrichum zoysiae]
MFQRQTSMQKVCKTGCFTIPPPALDFSTPAQSYEEVVDSPKVPSESILAIHPDGSDTYKTSDTGYLLAREGEQAPFTDEATCSVPCQPVAQQIGNCQTASLQQEGTKMALHLIGDLCCLENGSACSNLPSSELEPWVNTPMDNCKKVTGTVSRMLQCPGSEDNYFLAVACLVMSKVLDAYFNASAALRTRETGERRPSLSSSSFTLTSWSVNGSESSSSSASPPAREGGAKAAQQLLDELYQVRASMDLLGAKIASISSEHDSIFGGCPTSSCQDNLAAALRFSAKSLKQLYDKQHGRLKAISLQLIRDLKAFWLNQY